MTKTITITITDIKQLRAGDVATLSFGGHEFTGEVWASAYGELLVGGTFVRHLADQRSALVFISATREVQP